MNTKGFTLIELLVVIIIIGILSSIALPSFLGQASKARQSEAKLTVLSVLKAQSSHFIENQNFTGEWLEMGLGLPKDTVNYEYSLLKKDSKNQLNQQIVLAIPQQNDLRGYIGGIQVIHRDNNATVVSAVCEAKKAGKTQLSEKSIVFTEQDVKCSNEAREIK